MPFPLPVPGQVIRYSYLWRSEYRRGQEEGTKDRPCVVVLLLTDEEGDRVVTVLPVTHTPPSDPLLAVEIPHVTKRRLGLDDERSWVVLTEANRFTWPGPDLCMARPGDPSSVLYGELPGRLLLQIRDRFLAAISAGNAAFVPRTQ
ncbi:hypothetical protein [Frigoriglobus tundricola]|uniref:Growth inhibitor PemK n=1 Tax=Frigoriglobus tundricola TaxID=2774151 RepID=A0A6M5YYE9_9BACT|nr:hypothetical protein [Frigoriglobus tundricola]QJW98466.1 hypothetical protein FTUN_6056 [Frigoriglobus tundricola]